METIQFNVPFVASSVADRIAQSLESKRLAGDGPYTHMASRQLSELLLGAEILLTPSCTHALELSMRLLNLKLGDEVILPSFTFTSTANAIVLVGATPVFVDIEDSTQNIDVSQIEKEITDRTRAIFCINYGGISPDIEMLVSICKEHNLVLIEDNAHGLGALVNGRPLGTFGSLATQSFHETKNVNCGEGGCLVINDLKFLDRAEIIREKGTNRSRFFRGQVDKYTWIEAGSSWLLADPLAAMLTAQLDEFAMIQTMRHKVWYRYQEDLLDWSEETGVSIMHVPKHVDHPSHLFYLMTHSLEERTAFISHMKDYGIVATFHYQPLHSSEAGMRYGRVSNPLGNTIRAANCLVRLPLWAGMSDEQLNRIVDAVKLFRFD